MSYLCKLCKIERTDKHPGSPGRLLESVGFLANECEIEKLKKWVDKQNQEAEDWEDDFYTYWIEFSLDVEKFDILSCEEAINKVL